MHKTIFTTGRLGRGILSLAVASAIQLVGFAALDIPSDGSDGDLVVDTDTVIDLGLAQSGAWDTDNSAHAGKGIYDPEKWAVVFKYASVTINGGATLTFKNHSSRAPVVWLVSGDVTINGVVSLSGQSWLPWPGLAEPGPGGFRGGSAYGSAGFGPGGGVMPFWTSGHHSGSPGSHGLPGSGVSGAVYGNPSLLPLIGGSGGGGQNETNYNNGGGAGGGAILIAAGGTILINGSLHANGGSGATEYYDSNLHYTVYSNSGGGSGGAIRLLAESLAGSGRLSAGGGAGSGGAGRVRLERTHYLSEAGELIISPDPSVVTLTEGDTPLIWLPSDGPSVKVIAVNEQTPPPDPRAQFGAHGADVTLPQTSTIQVVVETTNVEDASIVKVRCKPQMRGAYEERTATVQEVINEDPLTIHWVPKFR